MVHCCAYECKSCGERKDPGITFHRFPKDPETFAVWVKNMRKGNWQPTINDRICSLHFEEDCFYKTEQKTRLQKGAVPTKFSKMPVYLQPKETGLKRKRRNGMGSRKISARNSLIQWTRPVYKGTNDSGLKVLCKQGSFTADHTTVEETALDDQIVRIPLYRHNLNDFREKYELWLRQQKSIGNESKHVSKSQVKRRGRPSKTISKLTEKQKVNQLKLSRSSSNNAVQNLKIKMFTKQKMSLSSKQVKTLSKAKNSQSHVKNGKIHNKKEDKTTKHTSDRTPSSGPTKSKTVPVTKLIDRNRDSSVRIMSQGKYYLKINNNRHISDLDHGLFNFKFSELVSQVKDVKLPSPTWKIKVMVKKGKVTSIIFTNKLELERSVSFHADKDTYKIVINNKPVALLGSPGLLNDLEDTEILLDIVQNIDPHNCMILYE